MTLTDKLRLGNKQVENTAYFHKHYITAVGILSITNSKKMTIRTKNGRAAVTSALIAIEAARGCNTITVAYTLRGKRKVARICTMNMDALEPTAKAKNDSEHTVIIIDYYRSSIAGAVKWQEGRLIQ